MEIIVIAAVLAVGIAGGMYIASQIEKRVVKNIQKGDTGDRGPTGAVGPTGPIGEVMKALKEKRASEEFLGRLEKTVLLLTRLFKHYLKE